MEKIKALCIAHGEKMLAVFCALFGFLALSSAQWFPNGDNPTEIEATANKNEQKIEARENAWPEEEKEAFLAIKDVRDLTAVESTYKINPGDFAVADFNPSIHPTREKRGLFTVIPAVSGVANYVNFALAMPPEAMTDEALDETMEGKSSDDKISGDDEFQKLLEAKFGKNKTAAGGFNESLGVPGLSGRSYGSGGPGTYGGGPGTYGGGSGGYGGGEGQYGGGNYGNGDLAGLFGPAMMAKEKRIRVTAGVSVRFVVDIQEQRARIRKALKLGSSFQEAQQHIRYTDIQVQRRQRQETINPWSTWEDLSSEDLGEILEDSFGIDRDIVSPGVTRNTLTMPLPRRSTGRWPAKEVSHPLVEDFELSAREQELIDNYNEVVTKKAEEQKANMALRIENKGFSKFSNSVSDIGIRLSPGLGIGLSPGMGVEENDYSDLASGLGDGEGGKLTDADKAVLNKANATAENRLLLVRFMDFTVDRGYQYEYRVRLVLFNPNFDHRVDELEDPSLAIEPELLSDWSEVSPSIKVPVAYRTYAEKVDARPGRPETVLMNVYTDTTETGLPIIGMIKTMVGLPVAGQRLMKVVDLRKDSLTTEDVVLATEDVLGDAESLGRLSTQDHPELAGILRQLPRGASLIQDQVTLIQEDGSLGIRTVGDNAQQLAMDLKEQEFILDTYKAWDREAAEAASGFFPGAGEGESEDGSYGSGSEIGLSIGSSASGSFFRGGGKRESSRERARNRRKSNDIPGLRSGGGGGGSGTK